MPKLVLIKHSLPNIDPKILRLRGNSRKKGIERCGRLARCLTDFLPAVLVNSAEPKARATADHLAERLALTTTTIDGLEEQHRMTARFLTNDALKRAMRRLFACPAEVVFGEETAEAASARFSATMERLLGEHTDLNLLVITHGTVISLYLSRCTGIDPYPVWEKLGLPSFVVLDRRTMCIENSEWQLE